VSERALRRIPLENFIDLKVDYAFKQLFGNEKNKGITVVFLNAILKRTGRQAIKEIAFDTQEVGAEYQGDKQSRLNILVRTQNNELINIEVQLTNQYDMAKRTLYYWSRIYNLQLVKSEGYHTLLPTITINICNFNLFNQTESFHNVFHLYEQEEKFRMDDVLEIHFIEMKKFIKQWHEKSWTRGVMSLPDGCYCLVWWMDEKRKCTTKFIKNWRSLRLKMKSCRMHLEFGKN